jgi:general secretion pathway protein B
MSFILDALKKSESDRQRQSGPALFEVKVAPRRPGLPAWALAIGVLFVVNLGIVLWILLRKPAPSPPAARLLAALPTAAAGTPAMAAVPAPSERVGATVPAATTTATSAATTAATPAALATAPAAGAPEAATPVPPAAADQGAPGGANPDDYAPASDAVGGSGHVTRGTASGVPLYTQAAAATQLPQLRLDLHAYAVRPEDRWVIINMHKVHEGDSLPEGVRVESITPEGAVLSYQGSRFLLPRD